MTNGDFPPPPPPPPSPPPEPGAAAASGNLTAAPWTGARVAAVLAAWLAGGIVGGTAALAAGIDPIDHPAGLAVTVLAQALAAFWVVRSFSRNHGTGLLSSDVGLEIRARDAKGIIWGIGLQVAVAALISPIAQWLLDDFDTQQQVAALAEETSDIAGRLLLIAMFVVVAPIIEEIIFRGVLLSWLANFTSRRAAIAVSAGAFAAVHLADPNAALAVPSLFVIGLALGWAAMKYGSLSLPIFMHAGVNLLGSIILMWGDEITDFLEETLEEVEALVALLPL